MYNLSNGKAVRIKKDERDRILEQLQKSLIKEIERLQKEIPIADAKTRNIVLR